MNVTTQTDLDQYWLTRRDEIVTQIGELEVSLRAPGVEKREWERFDKVAKQYLDALQKKVTDAVSNKVLGSFREFGFQTPLLAVRMFQTTTWKLKPHLMLYCGKTGKLDCPYQVYTAPTQVSAGKRVLWLSEVDELRISEKLPFLRVSCEGSELLSVYPANGAYPPAVSVKNEVHYRRGDKLRGTGDLIPNAFLAHAAMLEPLYSQFLDLVTRENRQVRRKYKLEHLKTELQQIDRLKAKWEKVILPSEQKIELIKEVDICMSKGAVRPQALLLKGPPGTGKTLLAKTIGDIAGNKFFKLTISDLKHPHIGEATQRVKKLWQEARSNKPAIVFLDECESLFGKRGASETDVIATDIVQAFLSEWDGKEDGIWLIGATNRREMIDDAILSRFGSEMEITLPSEELRVQILHQELTELGVAVPFPKNLIPNTQGFSGRDLSMLARRAVSLASPGRPTADAFRKAIAKMRQGGNTGVDKMATWERLILDQATKQSLQQTCAMLSNAEEWKENGVSIPTGILLFGPPGTGKTQIARTIANQSGLSFISATTAEIKAGYIGQSGNRVKMLFERARAAAPAILFIDELDIVAAARNGAGAGDSFQEEIVGQMLQEISGVRKSTAEVFLLAATNCPEKVDPAVLDRFTERLSIPLPDLDGRRRILAVTLEKKRIGFDLDAGCRSLAQSSAGLSGRALKNLVTRAEKKAVARAMLEGGPSKFLLRIEDFDCETASKH